MWFLVHMTHEFMQSTTNQPGFSCLACFWSSASSGFGLLTTSGRSGSPAPGLEMLEPTPALPLPKKNTSYTIHGTNGISTWMNGWFFWKMWEIYQSHGWVWLDIASIKKMGSHLWHWGFLRFSMLRKPLPSPSSVANTGHPCMPAHVPYLGAYVDTQWRAVF